MKDVDFYIDKFSHLRTDKKRPLGPAPHKPVMLLAVLDLIESGELTTNEIRYDTRLQQAFRDYFEDLAPSGWDRNAALPYFHLKSDGFWHIVWRGLETAGQIRNSKAVREHIDKVELDPELFEMLQDPKDARRLRRVLTMTYFSKAVAKVESHNEEIEVRRQLAPTLERWAAKPFEMNGADGEGERDPQFVMMVTHLYGHACAVCRLKILAVTGTTLVDAAHILPHAQFHNNDPRNGVALCKNHHWAFDRGLIAFTGDLRVDVSPTLDESAPTEWMLTQFEGAKVRVPANERLRPATEAVEWHRANVFWAE